MGLSKILQTHTNDAVRGFTCDFPSSGFRMHREGLSDHTADPSPLTDTLREQKVSTQRRVRICSQLGHEHGNCHCKRAGLSPTVDTGKGQEGKAKVRVSRALWAMGLKVESQNVGSERAHSTGHLFQFYHFTRKETGMFNSMCQIHWTRYAQTAGKT